ncbi:MAG: hypothetical protein JWN40_5364 [Phycisphaerales bacterium]|nr:hypothetical protein [Phycisphaerales bacterium]
MNTEIKWAAKLAHVKEVSLLGVADLAYWEGRLRHDNLFAAQRDGKAQVMIVATDSRFMGVPFREFSVSVLAFENGTGGRRDGAYLVHAWNSCRFFAFCERVFFSTPYSHGEVRVSTAAPVSIHVAEKGRVLFEAQMRSADVAGSGRKPSSSGAGGWDGLVFLPRRNAIPVERGKFFHARIAGHTETFPFLRETDALTMNPGNGNGFLAALANSNFAPEQWVVRADATHAKSKTYKRET